MTEKMWGAEPFWGLGYEWDPDWVYTDRQKELRETLRDRRTIVTLVLMPLLLYPLLSLVLKRFLFTGAVGDGPPTYAVACGSPGEAQLLESLAHANLRLDFGPGWPSTW